MIADCWSFAPSLLARAGRTRDPLERFKCVVAFAVAGLHRTVTMRKPFNPILGETFEAEFDDGATIFAEQTSHHPPVSHFQVLAPGGEYALSGWASWEASMRGNSVKSRQTGPTECRFADGQCVRWEMPEIWLSGILWGDRVLEFLGTMRFHDEANGLALDLKFNPEKVNFFLSMFGAKSATPSDHFRGEITRGGKCVAVADGSWLTHVRFDEKMFCEMRHEAASRPAPVARPLPSDCRFRRDLVELRAGRMAEAQAAKVELEEAQRADAKLRKAAGGGGGH
jgi:hypothetical protein